MKFTLVTPERRIQMDQEIDELVLPAFAGELDILPGHAPLMTTLRVGTLRYRLVGSNQFESVVISWGYCEINPQGILVLAETAETKEQIDLDRAERALKNAQAKIVEPGLEADQVKKFQRKMDRARARMNLAKTH